MGKSFCKKIAIHCGIKLLKWWFRNKRLEYSTRKSSRGILKSRLQDDYQRDDNKTHQRIKIFIQNPDRDDDAVSISSENEFERLKELYYSECRPINENLLKRYGSQSSSVDYSSSDLKCSTYYPHPHDTERSRSEHNQEPKPRSHHYCRNCHRRRQ